MSWRSSFATIRCPTRSDFTISAVPGPVRHGRFPGQAACDRRRLPPQPGDARPGDPGRRELLGVLPRRRRLVPAVALSGGRARPAHPAGEDRRVPPRPSAGRHPAPPVRGKLDQPQLRDLDRPSGRQPGLGRPARHPPVPGRGGTDAAATIRPRSRGPGTRSTSPRGPTGSGGTATTTRALWTVCSTTCSASTCATSTRFWAATRRARSSRRSRGGAPHRPLHDQPISFSNVKIDGRATYFEWIDAARYVCGNDRGTMTLVTRGLLQSSGSGSTPSGCSGPGRHRRGPARERLAEGDRLRIGFVDPADHEVVVMEPAAHDPVAYLNHAGGMLANGTTVQVATDSDPRAGRPVLAARPRARRPDPVLRRALQGRYEPRSSAARGDLRAGRPIAGFRADHVASLARGGFGNARAAERPDRGSMGDHCS